MHKTYIWTARDLLEQISHVKYFHNRKCHLKPIISDRYIHNTYAYIHTNTMKLYTYKYNDNGTHKPLCIVRGTPYIYIHKQHTYIWLSQKITYYNHILKGEGHITSFLNLTVNAFDMHLYNITVFAFYYYFFLFGICISVSLIYCLINCFVYRANCCEI